MTECAVFQDPGKKVPLAFQLRAPVKNIYPLLAREGHVLSLDSLFVCHVYIGTGTGE